MQSCALTFDTDWAPDAAIDFTAGLLLRRRAKATWFVTHTSPAIERLREHPELFELGIHPNFLAGSSHGDTPEQVLAHCMKLVPGALSMRTHALVQSTPLFDLVLRDTPVRCDVSLFLPRARQLELIAYEWKGDTLLRVPYFWEDDVEMLRHVPSWDAAPLFTHCSGLSVFAMHPIHVMLNSADMGPYELLKGRVSPLHAATDAQVAAHSHQGPGTRTLLEALLNGVEPEQTVRMRDLYDAWREGL